MCKDVDAVPRILIIEDDPLVVKVLKRILTPERGYEARVLADPAGAVADAAARPPDLVLLDILLPGADGRQILEALRRDPATAAVPVIVMSGLGSESDRVLGLKLGADDYLPKPFNPRELVARIHAVLRRRAAPPPPGAPTITEESVSFGKVRINLATRELERDEVTTLLTSGEFGLLRVLLEHPRQPMSRDKLMELARGREYEVFDRAIDVQISRLRKLVEEDPGKPRYIQTVWGFGYVFVPDGKKHE